MMMNLPFIRHRFVVFTYTVVHTYGMVHTPPKLWYGMVWYGRSMVVPYGMVWYGMVHM
jgi:hypothetical protein